MLLELPPPPAHALPISSPSDLATWGTGARGSIVGGGTKGQSDPVQQNTSVTISDNASGLNEGGIAYANSYSYSADLATGQIKFRTSASGAGNVSGQITWQDALFVDVAGASSTTVTDILFTHHLDGTVTAEDFEFSDEFGPGTVIPGKESVRQVSTTVQNNGNEFNPGWVDPTGYASVVPGGELNLWTGSYDTTIDVTIEGPTAIIPIFETINIYHALDGSLLFDDTSSFTVDLPPGVTATSASGILLTQTSTVPEPGTLVIFGTALAGLCLLRRRTTRSHPGDDSPAS